MQRFKRPDILLYLMAAAVPVAFGVWQSLLNNFTIEAANFTGVEIGILQSLREVPGFLAFTVVFVLLIFREQTLAIVSLLVMGLGTALTGYFPSEVGLYCTTVLMSLGFHYYETVNQSLSLQFFSKEEAPYKMGKMVAIGSAASLVAFSMVWVFVEILNFEMKTIYVVGGVTTMIIALFCWFAFPKFEAEIEQHKKLKLHKRYWLYYALTFMGGARRQIFVVFSGFLMVEKFGFTVSDIALMFLANGALNIIFAPLIGKMISKIGERRTLTIEYIGLIIIFSSYAVVADPKIAIVLYIVDHLLFSMAIAQKTYFQKIADPKDLAQTAGVAFSINHCAAIVLPALYGLLWVSSPALVFYTGAAMAGVSLMLAFLVPFDPKPGVEVQWKRLNIAQVKN
ncbi:MAG: MFS transporter [Oceanospirillaceae bacterium]